MIFKDNTPGKRRKKVDWKKNIWYFEEDFKEEKHFGKTLEEDTASHAVYPAKQGRRSVMFQGSIVRQGT